MQRYGFELKETRSKVPGWPSTYEWDLIEQEAGDYYLVADAQARIDELEAALREITKCGHWGQESSGDDTAALYRAREIARQALAQKEKVE